MSIPSGDEEPIFKVLLTNSSRAKVASIIFPLTGVFKAKKCYRTLYSSLNEQHKPQPTLSIITQVKPGRWWQLHMESNPADMRVNDFSWTAGATQLKSVPILPALVTLQTYPSSISWWTSRPQRVVGCINHLPLSSPPTPPPVWGTHMQMEGDGLPRAETQLPTAAGEQPCPAQAGHLGKDAESPLTPHGKSAHGVPTPPPVLQGSCKPWLNSPMRSQARFLMHWCSGIKWRI